MLQYFDVRLFKNIQFVAMLSSDCAIFIAWQAWIIYLIPYAEEKGLTPYQATSLASIGSVAYPVSLFIPVMVVEKGIASDGCVRFISLLITGTSFTVYPWVDSFIGQILITMPGIAGIGACLVTSISVAKTVHVGNISTVVAYGCLAVNVGRYVGGLVAGNENVGATL